MNNVWNRWVYKMWSPIYDTFFHSGVFRKARKQVFHESLFQERQHVLFVGVGTGADLGYVSDKKLSITAIDYSEDMLKKRKQSMSWLRFLFIKWMR